MAGLDMSVFDVKELLASLKKDELPQGVALLENLYKETSQWAQSSAAKSESFVLKGAGMALGLLDSSIVAAIQKLNAQVASLQEQAALEAPKHEDVSKKEEEAKHEAAPAEPAQGA